MHRAHEPAKQLLENSPASLRSTKCLLAEFSRAQLDREFEQAAQENAAIRQTADFNLRIASE